VATAAVPAQSLCNAAFNSDDSIARIDAPRSRAAGASLGWVATTREQWSKGHVIANHHVDQQRRQDGAPSPAHNERTRMSCARSESGSLGR